MMRVLSHDVSKDTAPQWCIGLWRCSHNKFIGVYMQRNMHRRLWIWRMCK